MRHRRARTWLLIGAVAAAAAAGVSWVLAAPDPPQAVPPLEAPPSDDPLAVDILGPGAPAVPFPSALDLGDPIVPIEQTVGPEGAEIVLDDGLVISIPEGAHPEGATYTITSRPVEGWSLPDRVVPASAVYEIDNGGGYADDVITVRMPLSQGVSADDGFAMGFFWNGTGLEGLPFVEADATSVTFATRHFSTTLILQWLGVTTVTVPTTDTGFRPGVDDWQFANYGSVARLGSTTARGGHCVGQSLTAIWYYLERHLAGGQPRLSGYFDNDRRFATPGLDYDDRLGYRLASAAQIEHTASGYVRHVERLAERPDDVSQLLAYSMAMYVTRKPQVVVVYDLSVVASATSWDVGDRGHAVIGYGTGTLPFLDLGGIWVADPNYPGRFRVIAWDATSNRFVPYASGENALDPGTPFPGVAYYGLSAIFNWPRLGAMWADFANDPAKQYFPTLSVTVTEKAGTRIVTRPLTDPLQTIVGHALVLTVNGLGTMPGLHLYDAALPVPVSTRGNGLGYFSPDTPGTYHLGLYVTEKTSGLFVDFIRFDLVVTSTALEVSIDPTRVEARPGEQVKVQVSVRNPLDLDASVALDGACSADLGTIASGATATYTCTFIAPAEPREHTIPIDARGDFGTSGAIEGSASVVLVITEAGTTTTSTTGPSGSTAPLGDLRIVFTRGTEDLDMYVHRVNWWDDQSVGVLPGDLRYSYADATTQVWDEGDLDARVAGWVILEIIDVYGVGGPYALQVTQGGVPRRFLSTGTVDPRSLPMDRVDAGDLAHTEVNGTIETVLGPDERHYYIFYHDPYGEVTGFWSGG